jgi:nitrogen-specific signal transduction histidine kinase
MRNKETSEWDERDFGEVLRHELNNPLTGILGNADLLLVDLRKRNMELPQLAQTRLETIAALALNANSFSFRIICETD